MERLAGKVILLWGWQRALTAFLSGAICVFAQAPFDFFAVCFVGFPVLVWLLDGATGEASAGFLRRLLPAFATGWWFGFGYFVAGLWWIGNALLVRAEEFAWALPLAVVALPALLAVFYGLATAFARLFWRDELGRIAALALGFGLAEWLRAVALTGFPWNAIGYAAMPTPLLMQSASVIGVDGMNAVAVFVFATPALLAARQRVKTGFVLAAALIVAHVGYGFYRHEVGVPSGEERLTVRIVQPSISQTEKWDAEIRDRIFRTLLDLSAAAPAQPEDKPAVIVWPETAVPFLLSQRPDALTAIGAALDEGQMLLSGAVRREGDPGSGAEVRYYNSVVAVNHTGELIDASDKLHLVPFGEYLPFGELLRSFGLQQIVESPGSFSPGSARRLISLPGGITALPLVCYEIIFSNVLNHLEKRPDVLVNVTNDAWYGNTPGPYQHFRQAQIRAVEQGIPVIRAANNGVSGIVDGFGNVQDGFALDVVGTLDLSVPLDGPKSYYSLTAGIWSWITLLFFAFLTAVSAMPIRRTSN